ncbi:hypothetical protein [Salinigranum halophilum]|uniref:hypothetical protein n=1 Tax=Salinigranum halophilum TaxID=2565931 RepID=UPI00115CA801|nr:hypothetical protein [Salinigranum halophilum]
MSADKEKIENILRSEDFPISEIREIIEERPDISITSRKKDELINGLLSTSWTDSQFKDLKQRFSQIRREKAPLGHYVLKIDDIELMTDQPKHEEIKQKLLIDEATLTEDGLKEGGFTVEEANQEKISGIYWTATETFRLDALRRLRSLKRTYDFGFEIDLENEHLYISGDNYGKVGELRSSFESLGFKLEPVTLDDLDDSDDANQIVREFVSDLRSSLREIKEQKDMSEFTESDGPSLLYIDEVKIKLMTGELRRANLEGWDDIWENDQVIELTESQDGRISRIKGEFEYKGTDFAFNIGYTDDYGRVSVEKKGQLSGVGVVEEGFEFLSELYEEYYVDA